MPLCFWGWELNHLNMCCRLLCWSRRVARGCPATSSPPGLISLITHDVTTATTTWRGASCRRTSRPGKITKNTTISSPRKGRGQHRHWKDCFCFLQPGCWRLRVGEPEQRHQCLHWRGGQLPPPSSSRGAQPLLTELTATPADLWHCLFLYMFAQSLLVSEASGRKAALRSMRSV